MKLYPFTEASLKALSFLVKSDSPIYLFPNENTSS